MGIKCATLKNQPQNHKSDLYDIENEVKVLDTIIAF
jgi:hypothetical protein